jgi:MYXO-CTERM domain-containing protein
MFTKSKLGNLIASVLIVFFAGACSGGGLGCECTSAPLPGGALPADQTVEGGGQIRVTPAGFTKITNLVDTILQDTLAAGFCVSPGRMGDDEGFPACLALELYADYCFNAQGGACGASAGCAVATHLDYLDVTPIDDNTVQVNVSVDINATIPLDGDIECVGFSCSGLVADAQNLQINANIDLGIDPADGELTITLAGINNTDFSGVNFSGCGVLSSILDLVVDILDSFIGDLILDLLQPTLNDLIQGFLPDPLGIAGMVDVGNMLEEVSPGTTALMEGRMVPGGYVGLNGGGMTLGLITGFNADEDIASRTPDLDSEPALCVPPFAAPNFAAPPASLPITTRGTYTLLPAGEFSGNPEPFNRDIALGMSETTLDLLGHHMVTSGGLCLGVGTAFVDQLNLQTISLLVTSVGELGSAEGNDPMLLVTRPQKPLDFTVGDGTDTSPNLTVHIQNLEVDFYGFIYERYTRLFTMSLTMNAGLNLMVDASVIPNTITPMLVGIDAANIQVQVINSEFVRETAQDLEAILPSVFDLALPLLANGFDPIEVPEFAGFSLQDLTIGRVTTTQDDFLAITATMAPGTMMKRAGEVFPGVGEYVAQLEAANPPSDDPVVHGATARLVSVDTPPADIVRGALVSGDGALPEVVIDLDTHDAIGRPLEWSYRISTAGEDGTPRVGLWRPFVQSDRLVLADRAFAWQGKYTIGLLARVAGNAYTTQENLVEIPVIIDSVGPRISEDNAEWKNGVLDVPAWDTVSHRTLSWAFARPGRTEPETAWFPRSALSRGVANGLEIDGMVQVFVRDEAGNITTSRVNPFHGQAGEGGCNCDATGTPTGGSILLVLITGALLLFRRRSLHRPVVIAAGHLRRVAPAAALWLGLSAIGSLVPGCNCGSADGRACETVEDCAGFCDGDEVPFCIDGECVCDDDIPPGKIGPYSDVAASEATGEAWVSAYAQTHGDLVVAWVPVGGRIEDVAWEWVDGVPDGPVYVPGATIRGGIIEPGPDVGMYTSIKLAPDGTPMVTYFDRDTGSLKFASRFGGAWSIHVVDQGTGSVDAPGGSIVGMYSSLTTRTDDGRPGVAYTAHVNEGGVVRAEVRWASAQAVFPASATDWTFWRGPTAVDVADIPPEDPAAPDIFPLPRGLGLFVDAALGPDQAPVIVYYDRMAGDLKLAQYDTAAGNFMAPVILDGASGDAGWSPTIGVDAAGVVHVAYVGPTQDDLQYVRSDAPGTVEIIDDGYRIVGQTEEGLPKPEFHFVGDDATMVITPNGPTVTYQDATTHELLIAQRNVTGGTWMRGTVAGAEPTWVGGYGFFASCALTSTEIVISTWVIDQPNEDQWVEVFRRAFLVE